MAKAASFGAVLAVDYSGGTTYVDVAQVRKIKPPMVENDEIDVTTHDSSGGFREFVAAPLKDGGEVELELVWDPALASHKNASGGLLYAANQVPPTVAAWELTLPDAASTTWTFDGFVKSFEPGELNIDNEMTATVIIRVSGAPTFV